VTDAIRRRYRRRPDRPIAAVRLALETGGLVYRKWGSEQRGKPGDWIVDNDGDVYTVDADVFARTYRQTGLGTYVKATPVWAEQAAACRSGRDQGRRHSLRRRRLPRVEQPRRLGRVRDPRGEVQVALRA